MSPDRFMVKEYLSYDMMSAWIYEAWRNPHRTPETLKRMRDAVINTIEPLHFSQYLFPDYQFNAQEFAQR
jgi:hypothetical protein